MTVSISPMREKSLYRYIRFFLGQENIALMLKYTFDVRSAVMGDPLDLLIINYPELFKDKHYQQISYRLVLLHAFQYYLASEGTQTFESLLKALRQVDKTIDGEFYEPKFVELYPFQKEGERGLLLVDRSKGCYPLVLYPKDKDPDAEHGNRIFSFVCAIVDLLDNHQFFENYLKQNTDWNKEIVEELKSKFTYPEKNRQVY